MTGYTRISGASARVTEDARLPRRRRRTPASDASAGAQEFEDARVNDSMLAESRADIAAHRRARSRLRSGDDIGAGAPVLSRCPGRGARTQSDVKRSRRIIVAGKERPRLSTTCPRTIERDADDAGRVVRTRRPPITARRFPGAQGEVTTPFTTHAPRRIGADGYACVGCGAIFLKN